MRRFRLDPIPTPGSLATLSAEASHHALRVAKLPRGAPLCVFDGAGKEASATLVEADDLATVRIDGPVRSACPPHPRHLVLAVLKGDAMALAVRMATEGGMTDLWPTLSARTIAKGDRGDRWARIAESAAQQCGRADVPTVHPVAPLADRLDAFPDAVRFVASPGAHSVAGPPAAAVVAIGPEGGWTDAELERFLAHDWHPLGLGDWVLRADTACAVALCQLQDPGEPTSVARMSP